LTQYGLPVYTAAVEAGLQFEWDAEKALANFDKHGVTFEFATRIFLDPEKLDIEASRPEDGEGRWKTVGTIDGKRFVAVYTLRGHVYRLISARRASKTEERLWLASL
jgi:uncharacterized protein